MNEWDGGGDVAGEESDRGGPWQPWLCQPAGLPGGTSRLLLEACPHCAVSPGKVSGFGITLKVLTIVSRRLGPLQSGVQHTPLVTIICVFTLGWL